ncbi:hypothetical protein fnug_230 [Pseudomonas phage fnug]|uniref:PHIKZ196 n=3 Tax=Phikzvirus phiKZ TaxID=169683 RepID=Q8SCW6_BPDPK|nr:hypothetical protein [Pseudomonas aeruginosa]NP_803762.1 PHIKZ196 [Pseudomonas phage phiKZ]ANM44995.1 hypothetical protein KTN4_237 [Pseudomonas phage KTN4]QJB22873.1 hypothetical protein fnug_230 [Pseudomonas phage fnug]USL86815.1 hypothetical protein CDGHABPJ_00357 [Pseudomonas phage OMKO1]WNV47901.1 hypothetical protein [Pseudomonas phage fMGyn-Pae01]WPJ69356.1 hypothetical protein PAZH1_233 [Pseudomonas phage PA_ZH1]
MLFNKVIRYFKRRRCNTSELIEINELILKAARRQNYDLGHLISYLGDGNDPKFIDFIKKEYSEIHAYYNSVFNPADFGKNYKTKLHSDLLEAETKLNKFKELCKKHNIDYSHIVEDEIPF